MDHASPGSGLPDRAGRPRSGGVPGGGSPSPDTNAVTVAIAADGEQVIVPCPWCGRQLAIRNPRLAVCSGCGAGLTWPIPDSRELELAYDGWYRPTTGRFAGGGDRLLRLSRARLARRLDRIAP